MTRHKTLKPCCHNYSFLYKTVPFICIQRLIFSRASSFCLKSTLPSIYVQFVFVTLHHIFRIFAFFLCVTLLLMNLKMKCLNPDRTVIIYQITIVEIKSLISVFFLCAIVFESSELWSVDKVVNFSKLYKKCRF